MLTNITNTIIAITADSENGHEDAAGLVADSNNFSVVPPSTGRATTASTVPMNPDSFVNVAKTEEEIERLANLVNVRGIEIAKLKASAVRVATEHLVEIKNLKDLNDKLMTENNVLRAAAEEIGTAALTKASSSTDSEDYERILTEDNGLSLIHI